MVISLCFANLGSKNKTKCDAFGQTMRVNVPLYLKSHFSNLGMVLKVQTPIFLIKPTNLKVGRLDHIFRWSKRETILSWSKSNIHTPHIIISWPWQSRWKRWPASLPSATTGATHKPPGQNKSSKSHLANLIRRRSFYPQNRNKLMPKTMENQE